VSRLRRVVLTACAAALAAASPAAASTRTVAYPPPDTPWSSADYDGKQFGADQADTTTLPTIHAVYLYPSDAPNRFASFAAMFQRDARRGSAQLQSALGYGFRWDDRVDATGRRLLDVTVLRSGYNLKKLSGSSQFSLARSEVAAKLANPNKKYMIWLDAPSSYCGQSDTVSGTTRTASNAANGRTYTLVYRYYDAANAQGGFCAPILHELFHSMGAVSPSAPHYTAGAHCVDNANDILCNGSSAIPFDSSLGGAYVDYRNDDYWDPGADVYSGAPASAKLGWWTVNLNRFLCPPSASDPTAADCAGPNSPAY